MNKEKFIVEYDLKSVSPTLLWSYIGTKNGLADWFADDVQNEEKLFTGATMLVITDFAYPDEMADSRGLWDHQIETLRRKLGV